MKTSMLIGLAISMAGLSVGCKDDAATTTDMGTTTDMSTTTDSGTDGGVTVTDLGFTHDGDVGDMTVVVLDGGAGVTCTDVCVASMSCEDGGTSAAAMCGFICPTFERLAPTASCTTQFTALIRCFGESADLCSGSDGGGNACEETALQPLAICFNTYCADHMADEDCQTVASLFGGGGETDGGVIEADGGVIEVDAGVAEDAGEAPIDAGPPA